MIVVPFEARHILDLQLQEAQKGLAPFIDADYARMLEGQYAFSALEGEEVLMVGGIMKVWDNRGLVWAFVGKGAGKRFLTIHKATLDLLDKSPYLRLEASTSCDFEQGHHWLKMLGFEIEAECMRAYNPDGSDAALYARVKA